METITTQKIRRSLLQAVETKQTSNETINLRLVYKSDLNNHRFAQHENKTVQDTSSWDQSWFANYE